MSRGWVVLALLLVVGVAAAWYLSFAASRQARLDAAASVAGRFVSALVVPSDPSRAEAFVCPGAAVSLVPVEGFSLESVRPVGEFVEVGFALGASPRLDAADLVLALEEHRGTWCVFSTV